ncbi:MAG: molybdenum cofactor guanylyltransferase, partial [Candidatus Bathyarchaeota archaeon]|nr:molybdenum cofactor guanylyltransferase [Candidatus Bathyarchaeota archaeon]
MNKNWRRLLLEKSAIILAGGFSRRFGQDKGLLLLANKPLIKHVLAAIANIVDEKIVVTSSKNQAESYAKLLGLEVKVFVDEGNMQSPLVGTLKGFKEAQNEYVLLLPCDTPLLSKDILLLLFDLCPNKNAVIPRWPNGYIEPLQAVYRTKPALEAAEKALSEGRLNMQAMVDKLRGI